MQVSHDGAVATVVLNNPAKGNSLSWQTKEQLRDRLEEVAGDRGVRAVILTGAGRSFCVGQDLGEHAEGLRLDRHAAFATIEKHYNPIVRSLATMPKPVLAAVNGLCVGAGLGFALACDLRIVGSGAKFATAFTAIGLTCDSGLSATLARAVGSSRASELVLLGEAFTAAQAAEWGIANQLVPDEELQDVTIRLARRLAAGPTLAYAEAKRALAQGVAQPLVSVLEAEASAQARLGLTADHLSAVDAFLRKEAPQFVGG